MLIKFVKFYSMGKTFGAANTADKYISVQYWKSLS